MFTDRIRSMAEGTIFTGVCHSFCPQGEGGGGFWSGLRGRVATAAVSTHPTGMHSC